MRNMFAGLLLVCILTSCSNEQPKKPTSDYQAKKTSISDQEKSAPLSFLSVRSDYHKNLLGNWVIEGTVSNNATVATYKNITLRIQYVDADGGKMIKDDAQIDGEVKPNNTLDFKIKEPKVKGARSVTVKILSAE